MLAELAGDETFVLVKSDYAELAIPLELVSLDGRGAPARAEVIEVFLAVLIQQDGLFSPLFAW